jgi:hypothetical protein
VRVAQFACRCDTATRTGRKKASYEIGPAAMVLWYPHRIEKMPHLRLAGDVTVYPLLQLTIRFCLTLVSTSMFCPRMDQE